MTDESPTPAPAPTPAPKASTTSKTALVMAALLGFVQVWQYVYPMLPVMGVPKPIADQINTAVVAVKDHESGIQALADRLEAIEMQLTAKPDVPAKPETPTPSTPVVSPDVTALQDQIKRQQDQMSQLTDQIRNILNPPAPIQVVQPVVLADSKIVVTDSTGKAVSASTVPADLLFQVTTSATSKVGWQVSQHGAVKLITLPASGGFVFSLASGAWVEFFLTDFTANTQTSVRIACQSPPSDTPKPGPLPQPTPMPVPPTPVTTGFDAAAAADELARQAEDANASPAIKATALLQGILSQGMLPADFVARVKVACPVIDRTPAVDLTAEQVAAIRGVR